MFKTLSIVETSPHGMDRDGHHPHGGEGMRLGLCALLVLALFLLAGCGQKGPLRLPSDPKAAQRATLLESLRPGTTGSDERPAAAPAAPTAAPAATDLPKPVTAP